HGGAAAKRGRDPFGAGRGAVDGEPHVSAARRDPLRRRLRFGTWGSGGVVQSDEVVAVRCDAAGSADIRRHTRRVVGGGVSRVLLPGAKGRGRGPYGDSARRIRLRSYKLGCW